MTSIYAPGHSIVAPRHAGDPGTVPNSHANWVQSPSAFAQLRALPDINLDNYPAVSRAPIARALDAVTHIPMMPTASESSG